jgi:hypothetical protein
VTILVQATVDGLLKSQIAQSPYLTQDEKRLALTETNCGAVSSAKTSRTRAILVRVFDFSRAQARMIPFENLFVTCDFCRFQTFQSLVSKFVPIQSCC